MPAFGVFVRHVRDLELADIRMSFEMAKQRPALIGTDNKGLQIDDFKAQVAENFPVARFEQAEGLVVRNSPAIEKLAKASGR